MPKQQVSDDATLRGLKTYALSRYQKEVDGSERKMEAARTYALLSLAESLLAVTDGYIADQLARIAMGVEMLEHQ